MLVAVVMEAGVMVAAERVEAATGMGCGEGGRREAWEAGCTQPAGEGGGGEGGGDRVQGGGVCEGGVCEGAGDGGGSCPRPIPWVVSAHVARVVRSVGWRWVA